MLVVAVSSNAGKDINHELSECFFKYYGWQILSTWTCLEFHLLQTPSNGFEYYKLNEFIRVKIRHPNLSLAFCDWILRWILIQPIIVLYFLEMKELNDAIILWNIDSPLVKYFTLLNEVRTAWLYRSILHRHITKW